MSDDPRHLIGAAGERVAGRYLRQRGHRIIARNARTRRGELDLITMADATLVFVEVKTARARARGAMNPVLSVTPRKRTRVRMLAREWLAATPAPGPYERIRFDVIAIVLDPVAGRARVQHIEAAF